MPYVPPAVSGGSDAALTTSDITTNDFSITKHGFTPKGTNVGNFLKDDGTWATVTATAATFSPNLQTSAANQTIPANSSIFLFRQYVLTGTAKCINHGYLINKN